MSRIRFNRFSSSTVGIGALAGFGAILLARSSLAFRPSSSACHSAFQDRGDIRHWHVWIKCGRYNLKDGGLFLKWRQRVEGADTGFVIRQIASGSQPISLDRKSTANRRALAWLPVRISGPSLE